MKLTKKDSLRLVTELIERINLPNVEGIELLNICRDVISLGVNEYKRINHSVPFQKATEVSIEERIERRERTVYEIKHFSQRIMDESPEIKTMKLRYINSEFCKDVLKKSFKTNSQFNKARTVLHSIFSCGIRHGWCSINPVDAIPRYRLKETKIEPLPWDDIVKLLQTARKKEHRSCLPAVGLMLWAGVRPTELMRISWDDIDWQEKIINLRPQHTKTGGCRHITMHPVLIRWLKNIKNVKSLTGMICPTNWAYKWKKLRQAADIKNWQQDVLRHTFASYHLKKWHNVDKLQEEMGHRSSQLLRTRYLSMKGINSKQVKIFWSPGKLG